MCSCSGHHQSALETASEGNRVKTASTTSLLTILWTCRCGVGHVWKQRRSLQGIRYVLQSQQSNLRFRDSGETHGELTRGLPEGLKDEFLQYRYFLSCPFTLSTPTNTWLRWSEAWWFLFLGHMEWHTKHEPTFGQYPASSHAHLQSRWLRGSFGTSSPARHAEDLLSALKSVGAVGLLSVETGF